MTAAASYEAIGKILRTKPNEVEALVETITDPKAEPGVRCAALDRYVEVRKADSFELLTDIVEDFDQPEELRAHCQHWLLDPRIEAGRVKTKGAATFTGSSPEEGPFKPAVLYTLGEGSDKNGRSQAEEASSLRSGCAG